MCIRDSRFVSGYKLLGHEGDERLVKTKDYIKVSCPNINHKPYKIRINDFLQGKRCRRCYFENNTGENNPAYNPDLTEQEREAHRFVSGYKEWRRAVYERDNYACKKCKDDKGGNLVAHHLDGYHWCKEKRTEIDNGITLCVSCHNEFHRIYGTKDNTKEQLMEWL